MSHIRNGNIDFEIKIPIEKINKEDAKNQLYNYTTNSLNRQNDTSLYSQYDNSQMIFDCNNKQIDNEITKLKLIAHHKNQNFKISKSVIG